jgi:hypothetical protein
MVQWQQQAPTMESQNRTVTGQWIFWGIRKNVHLLEGNGCGPIQAIRTKWSKLSRWICSFPLGNRKNIGFSWAGEASKFGFVESWQPPQLAPLAFLQSH